MADALHPQTFLTLGMNDGDLPVGFGGPLRLRVPRQLGYKSVKYITRLTATDNLKTFGKGLGSGLAGSRLCVVRRHLIRHLDLAFQKSLTVAALYLTSQWRRVHPDFLERLLECLVKKRSRSSSFREPWT